MKKKTKLEKAVEERRAIVRSGDFGKLLQYMDLRIQQKGGQKLPPEVINLLTERD